jgi:hypothetical protein
MDSVAISNLIISVEKSALLLAEWGLKSNEFCLLDGPAIKLHNQDFDSSPWRDHLNIYVREQVLPWKTKESELTVPPLDSAELTGLIDLIQSGTQIHLVPAERYYKAGFERSAVLLPSGRPFEAATMRGCSQVWSYKSAEILASGDFQGDVERIVGERIVRLKAALTSATEDDVQNRLQLLQNGYEALRENRIENARAIFCVAAGPNWHNPC